jgi:hypothetical protein
MRFAKTSARDPRRVVLGGTDLNTLSPRYTIRTLEGHEPECAWKHTYIYIKDRGKVDPG